MNFARIEWALLAAGSLLCACQSGGAGFAAWEAEVVIHRDRYGMPHVEAQTDAGAVYGWMYARAEDEFEKIEQACFLTLGRNSEFLGELGLPWDRLVHALEIPVRARKTYAQMAPEVRVLCDAGSAAMNAFRERHPERGAGLIQRFEPWHFVAQSYSWHLYKAASALQTELGHVVGLEAFAFPEGSNAWAIGPERTERGHALLLINPHLTLGAVFEGHCQSRAGLNVTGGASFGRSLLPLYGHNGRLAWALTVNNPDVVDLYTLVCHSDGGQLRHLWEGAWRPLQRRTQDVLVKRGAQLERETLTFWDSPAGPLVAQRGATQVAIAVAGLENNRFLETHYGVAKARDRVEFEAALAQGGWLFHNVVYADQLGDIWYLYGGQIPVRPRNESYAGTRSIQREEDRWHGIHALADLPQVLNPDCGWLQNCNSSPFITTQHANPQPSDFPAYLVGNEETDARAERSRAILTLSPRLSLDDLERLAFDPTVGAAATWIEEIEAALQRLKDPTRPANESDRKRAQRLQPVLDTLQAWDHKAAADSVASTVFFLWFERYMALANGGPSIPTADRVLAEVVADLERRWGSWQVPWGELNRLRRPGSLAPKVRSWPIVGGHGSAGVQATFLSRFEDEQARQRFGYRGSGYVSVVELSNPIRSRSILPYGQSSQPGSPHFEDQAPLYAAGRMKANPFTLEDVRAQAVRSYRPGTPQEPSQGAPGPTGGPSGPRPD